MVWIHHLLDDDYSCVWKTIELSALRDLFPDLDIVWKSHVPDSVVNKLCNHQVAESIKTWYVFRKHALDDILEISFDEFSAQQYLWFNKQIRSKSKQYFYYQDWFEKGIYFISDLIDAVDPNNIRIKTFEDLVFDFQISEKDRRKYNFLLKYIPSIWLDFPSI